MVGIVNKKLLKYSLKIRKPSTASTSFFSLDFSPLSMLESQLKLATLGSYLSSYWHLYEMTADTFLFSQSGAEERKNKSLSILYYTS